LTASLPPYATPAVASTRALQSLGSVLDEQELHEAAGGFGGDLDDRDRFGASVCALGDVNADGRLDLAVGGPYADELPPLDGGAVWALFLNADGSLGGHQRIGTTAGGFGGTLDFFDHFGRAVAGPGDLDGDGVPDLAVGARGDDDGGADLGAVWLLSLRPDGTVAGHSKISATAGGSTGALDSLDRFGFALAGPGDVDADGHRDLVVGAFGDDDGGTDRGALWVLFLESVRPASVTLCGSGLNPPGA